MIRFAALVLGLTTPAWAQVVSTPAPNTANRAAIMDAIREGSGARSIFIVDHLKVVSRGGRSLAFADVRPANDPEGFRGWVLLADDEARPWRYIWSVDSRGQERCSVVSRAYAGTIDLLTMFNAPMTVVSPRFQRERAEVNSRSLDEMCPGKVVLAKNR